MNEFAWYFTKFTGNYTMQRKQFCPDQLNQLFKVKILKLFQPGTLSHS